METLPQQRGWGWVRMGVRIGTTGLGWGPLSWDEGCWVGWGPSGLRMAQCLFSYQNQTLSIQT